MKPSARRFPLTLMLALIPFALLFGSGCSSDDAASDNPLASGAQDDLLIEDPIYDLLQAKDGEVADGERDRIGRLAELLGLDQEQVDALVAAYASFRDEIADIRMQFHDGVITREEAWEMVGAARDELEAALQLILTEEQYDQLLELRMQHRPGPRPGHIDPLLLWARWLAAIDASSEQTDAILAAVQTLVDGMADLRTQLMDGDLTRDEAHAAAMALRSDFQETLREVLTPAQLEALRELRSDCQHRRR